jgi:hypothetical protein
MTKAMGNSREFTVKQYTLKKTNCFITDNDCAAGTNPSKLPQAMAVAGL